MLTPKYRLCSHLRQGRYRQGGRCRGSRGRRYVISLCPQFKLTDSVQVLSEAFGVDPDSEEDKKQYSIAPATLTSLLDVYLNARAKSGPSASTSGPSASAAETKATSSSTPGEPTAEDKKKADELKLKGNSLMGQKQYNAAIEAYDAAIKLNPDPVYYSNRAAAYGSLGQHDKAAEDAESAISIDPKFAKGYSRLGHARLSLDDVEGAIEAYENGLKIDPSNAAMTAGLASAKGRSRQATSREAASPAPGTGAGGMPDLSSLASMLGGMGGAGGGGGMPDLAAMMQNPQLMAA